MARILVCITGASGAIYPLRLLSALASQGITVHLVCSPWGSRVVIEETGRTLGYWIGRIRASGGPQGSAALVITHPSDDFSSPLASGSFRLDGTVILPCSMGSLGSIASGVCSNLVHRAAAVALKEGWPLVLVPRESPLSLVDIRSMEKAKEAGAVILPACPSFYSRPQTIEDLADTLVHRILDRLGTPARDAPRWGERRT
ncbi:MAG TPA: UbiX family flavin prenyltransferase [Rectinemataceae bacterium]